MGQTGFPAWLLQLVSVLVPCLGVFGFVLQRHDVTTKRTDDLEKRAFEAIDHAKKDASTAVEHAKKEAAEALMAHADRMDSRHETVRRELATQVASLGQRIDRIGDDMVQMVRKEDLRPLFDQMGEIRTLLYRKFDANAH